MREQDLAVYHDTYHLGPWDQCPDCFIVAHFLNWIAAGADAA